MSLSLATVSILLTERGNLSLLLGNKVCAIAVGFVRAGASVFLLGRTQSKRDRVADESISTAQSIAKVAANWFMVALR